MFRLIGKRITLKALANSSPGFALWQPWEHKAIYYEGAIVKGLRGRSQTSKQSQLLQSCDEKLLRHLYPGLPKRNPGLELANAFSVIRGIKKPLLSSSLSSNSCILPTLTQKFYQTSPQGLTPVTKFTSWAHPTVMTALAPLSLRVWLGCTAVISEFADRVTGSRNPCR
jgi:hypothetical protein